MTPIPSPDAVRTGRTRSAARRAAPVRFAPLLALGLALALLAACAPAAERTAAPAPAPVAEPARPEASADPAFETPQAARVEATAEEAYHRMEIGRIRNGGYDTTPLVDLTLPPGTRWTVVDFSGDGYTLRFTSDALPGIAWEVSPAGVRRIDA